jgi:hypothetical protein
MAVANLPEPAFRIREKRKEKRKNKKETREFGTEVLGGLRHRHSVASARVFVLALFGHKRSGIRDSDSLR